MLRQHYVAGEKLLVDYAGQTVPVVDRQTGEVREAQIFVAVVRTEKKRSTSDARTVLVFGYSF